MSEKILIACDSTADLNAEIIEKYGIQILPLGINMGRKMYTDGVDIDPDKIYEEVAKTGELPKTAAVNIAAFEDFFAKKTEEGYSVVLVTISSEMSSTFSNARVAAENYENVYVVNSKNLSTGGGLLVLHAAQLREVGKSAKEIYDECSSLVPCVDASFVIDSLEYLHKGGRCSTIAALGANLLKLKPCIGVKDGKMGVGKKYRGKFSLVLPQYIADRMGDASDIRTDKIFVTHAGCEPEIIESCVNEVKKIAPEANVMITRAGCTISSHCGRNTLGVLFIRKNPIE